MTLKAMSHVARLKSDLALLDRAKAVPGSVRHAALSECTDLLARKILNYPQSLVFAGLRPDMTFTERKQALGIQQGEPMTEAQADLCRIFETQGRKSRRANWIWRIGQEARSMSEQGWYGFFVTLTVDPMRCPDSAKLWQDGIEFRKYLRKLARLSAQCCGHGRAIQEGASIHEYVRHVGVVEHGSSNHHHHMHVLIWLRGIPEKWKKCPNKSIRDPKARSNDWCRAMASYWPWALPGIGRAKYFRHEGDVWSRLGFCVPVSRTGKPMSIRSPEAAGFYVAKYMEKEDKAWTHRVKATRNLGLETLKAMLGRMNLARLRPLAHRPRTYDLNISLQTIHTVPSGIIRSLAKQEIFCREWARGQQDWKAVLNERSDAFKRMLQSVKDGLNPRKMDSRQFFDWVTEHLPEPEGYCEKKLLRSHRLLAYEFPVDAPRKVNHIGGNQVDAA